MDGQWYHNAPKLIGRSGSDGVVVFEVKQPIPPLMDVLDWWAYPCSNPEAYSTRVVLEDGVIALWPTTGIKRADKWCTADSQSPQPQRQPGQGNTTYQELADQVLSVFIVLGARVFEQLRQPGGRL